jgi:hypothetical protein
MMGFVVGVLVITVGILGWRVGQLANYLILAKHQIADLLGEVQKLRVRVDLVSFTPSQTARSRSRLTGSGSSDTHTGA